MCCGQGGDNSKFHISLIHKHSVMDILMCCGQGGGVMDILMCVDNGETTLNSIYHSYTNIQTVMDILMCCGQGGDNSKFHISLIHKHSDSYGYIDVLWTRGRQL